MVLVLCGLTCAGFPGDAEAGGVEAVERVLGEAERYERLLVVSFLY